MSRLHIFLTNIFAGAIALVVIDCPCRGLCHIIVLEEWSVAQCHVGRSKTLPLMGIWFASAMLELQWVSAVEQ
jgi:hypothetical protein